MLFARKSKKQESSLFLENNIRKTILAEKMYIKISPKNEVDSAKRSSSHH